MNEQLVVKNFGPIKDATVAFKRVTVFIGPTGGGKSTLAKLGAIFHSFQLMDDKELGQNLIDFYNIGSFQSNKSDLQWYYEGSSVKKSNGIPQPDNLLLDKLMILGREKRKGLTGYELQKSYQGLDFYRSIIKLLMPVQIARYIPAERVIIAIASQYQNEQSINKVGFSRNLSEFINNFYAARKKFPVLDIPFLNIKYIHKENHDFVQLYENDKILNLYEIASGLQVVIPLLMVVELLSCNTGQAQSFIIEEPELNLYPTAQQGLLNWLVEKCTKGENDLTITTHSPYLLAHFNTLLFAYQVAQSHPERADEIAKIVPRESWINPAEFAAYHVEGQKENGVCSIVNPETGLISYNGLDAIASAEATEFEKLLDINAGLAVEW